MKCTVFFISDGTGITAEGLGLSLMTQFEHVEFEPHTLPYLNTLEKAQDAVAKINNAADKDGFPPIVFATLVRDEIRQAVTSAKCLLIDFFTTFLGPLEQALGEKSSYTMGRTHSMHNPKLYQARIDAINFTLNTDDGANPHQYQQAEVILLGASRSGKTPTSLYLALQFGVKTANYPLTLDDLENAHLPKLLAPFKKKLFGLTIDVERLHSIRNGRRPDSHYASKQMCLREIRAIEGLFKQEGVPFLNTTTLSIEEISTQVMNQCGIERKLM